jgi:hypothetical protein
MNKEARFKIGDNLEYGCMYGYHGYVHVDRIDESNGVYYYYDDAQHCFIDEDFSDNIRIVDDNDDRFIRWELYLSLKKEFEN